MHRTGFALGLLLCALVISPAQADPYRWCALGIGTRVLVIVIFSLWNSAKRRFLVRAFTADRTIFIRAPKGRPSKESGVTEGIARNR